jgi:hypothetical protein
VPAVVRRCVALLLVALLGVPFAGAAGEGAVDLFDGKSLDGWIVEGAGTFKEGDRIQDIWSVRDGLLRCAVNRDSYGFLRYGKKEFGDFHLSLEYRFAAPGPKGRRGNSGVGIRTVVFDPKKSAKTRPSFAAYEVQLLDDSDRKPDKHSCASLYTHVAPSEQAARPAPQWNALQIECIGPRIRITLNGKKVVDFDQTTLKATRRKPLKGYLNLQNHGTPIDFRNIRIREITK